MRSITMGRYSGYGMGPAEQVIRFNRSGKAMQLALDRRHWRDPETLAADRELGRLAGLNARLEKLVQKLRATGEHPLVILGAMAGERREAKRRADAVAAEAKRLG